MVADPRPFPELQPGHFGGEATLGPKLNQNSPTATCTRRRVKFAPLYCGANGDFRLTPAFSSKAGGFYQRPLFAVLNRFDPASDVGFWLRVDVCCAGLGRAGAGGYATAMRRQGTTVAFDVCKDEGFASPIFTVARAIPIVRMNKPYPVFSAQRRHARPWIGLFDLALFARETASGMARPLRLFCGETQLKNEAEYSFP